MGQAAACRMAVQVLQTLDTTGTQTATPLGEGSGSLQHGSMGRHLQTRFADLWRQCQSVAQPVQRHAWLERIVASDPALWTGGRGVRLIDMHGAWPPRLSP